MVKQVLRNNHVMLKFKRVSNKGVKLLYLFPTTVGDATSPLSTFLKGV
jgi:hypothetical protein